MPIDEIDLTAVGISGDLAATRHRRDEERPAAYRHVVLHHQQRMRFHTG
jgi:hypothetical protein